MTSTLEDLAESYSAPSVFTAVISCPICAGGSRIAHAAHNIHPDKHYRFNFRICRECGHGFIDPMPSQGLLSHLYARGSHSVVGVGWADLVEPMSVPGRFVCERELVAGSVPQRYLELGVGKGLLYEQFTKNGWMCAGIEPGSWGRKFNGVYGNFSELPASFCADVIVAIDVLEHVADPVATLRRLREFAAANARLYAAMPNLESLRAAVGRRRWRMLRPLGHVHYWSRSSVAKAFSRAGFGVEEMRKTDLWLPGPIRTLRSAVKATIEYLGLGDQWIVSARAR